MVNPDEFVDALKDRYRIERELGRGGFAVVYLAHDLRHDRDVALKFLHSDVAASIGSERFEREIKLAARLQHPHILGVFDSGNVNGRLWFAMPFVEGESLRARLTREGQLPIADAVRIGREIADALDYAHRRGVIHRDIKPENILLSGRHAIVADFGISRSLTPGEGSLTQTGVSIGSPGYMSLEQTLGERTVDARTDLYSLGCVMYEMLTGEAPFTGPTQQAIIARMLTEEPRAIRATRAGVSEELEAIIRRAVARAPADRYATAGEFGAALEALPDSRPGAGPTTSTTAPASTAALPASRRRAPTVGIFALGVLIGLGALFAWRARHPKETSPDLVVLPFDNVGRPEDAYFADGITEEVRGKLASIPGLRVLARTSSNAYKGSNRAPRDIGNELGVEYILMGTVRWEQAANGQRLVRVTPELIRVRDGSTTWQQPFDAVLSDVFGVQGNIATRVAEALDVTLGTAAQQALAAKPTKNLEAYEEFLKGERVTQAATRTDTRTLQEALAHYQRAVALDTTFALAWSRVAWVSTEQFGTNPTEDVERVAQDGITRAMRLSPDQPQVRWANSRYQRVIMKDYEGSLAQLDTALIRAPNEVSLLTAASSVNALLSRFDTAIDQAKRSYALDPRNPSAAIAVARTMRATRRFAEAEEYYLKAAELSPDNMNIALSRVINQVSLGDLPRAQAIVRELLAIADSTQVAAHFALYQEMMWVLDEPLLRRIVRMTPANFGNNRQQWALKVGATWNLLGDSARALAYGDSARIVAEAQLAAFPNDAQLHELRARSLALAGRKADAIAEAETALKMRETALDASTGPYVRYQAARVFVQSGAYDRALEIIAPLLTTNYSDVTPGWLTLEPIFRPLKAYPRFNQVVAGK